MSAKPEIQPSIVHRAFYGKLRHLSNGHNIVLTKDIMSHMKMGLRILTYNNKYTLISEMENLGLLRRIANDRYLVMNKRIKMVYDPYGTPLW